MVCAACPCRFDSLLDVSVSILELVNSQQSLSGRVFLPGGLKIAQSMCTGALLHAVPQIPIFKRNILFFFLPSIGGIKKGQRVVILPGCHFSPPCAKGTIAAAP